VSQGAFSAAQVVAGAILMGSGLSKLRHLDAFSGQVRAFDVLPRRLSSVVGRALPAVEVIVGTGLLVAPRLASIPASGLFTIFAAAVGLNLVRGRTELVCGCFGPEGRHRISRSHMIGNLLLAGTSLFAYGGSPVTMLDLAIGGSMIVAFATVISIVRLWMTVRRNQLTSREAA